MPLRHRRRANGSPDPDAVEPDVVRLDPQQLHGLFAAPSWLRDLGVMSWLLVGFGAFILGLVWLAGQVSTIVVPVILGAVVAAVAAPLVSWFQRHGIPRIGGAILVLLLLVAIAAGVLLLVLAGLASESSSISRALTSALDEVEGWLKDLGISKTEVKSELEKAVPSAGNTLISGLGAGIEGLA